MERQDLTTPSGATDGRPGPSHCRVDGLPSDVPQPPDGIALYERPLFVVTLALWITIFVGGILIDSSPYRERVSGAPLRSPEILKSWVLVIGAYTITNVAILCVLASILGALGRRARLDADDRRGVPRDRSNPYVSAAIRGFFIYLVVLSGILVVVEHPFSSPTPQQYVRLAGLVSLFSFVASYNPRLFTAFLERVSQVVETGTPRNR